MPLGQVAPPEQSRAQAEFGMSFTVRGTQAGSAVAPGVGTQSTAALVHSLREQNPSVVLPFMSVNVKHRPGLGPHWSSLMQSA